MQPPVAQNLPAGRRFSVLVVEDDAGFARMLMDVIQEEGGEGVHCLTLAAARGQLAGRDFK